jgi:hypothetical protein
MLEKPPHITEYLRRHRAAAGLLACCERDLSLLQTVRRLLPAELSPHCLHATLDGGRVHLLSDGPVWASRLRFSVPQLVAGLAGPFPQVREVRIRVSPAGASPPRTDQGASPSRLSEATVAHLRETAAGVADPDLAAALLRLAGSGVGSGQDVAKGRGA